MSRAKFDFSGYDPEAHKKQKPPSPKVKITVKEEEDMEVFTGTCEGQEAGGDIDKLNKLAAQKLQSQLENNICQMGETVEAGDMAAKIEEINSIKQNINQDEVHFRDLI